MSNKEKKNVDAPETTNQELPEEITNTLNSEMNEKTNDISTDSTIEKDKETDKTDISEPIAETKEPNPEEKLAAMTDKYLRLTAEFDNYRKRTLKERMEMIKSAGEDIFMNFLPIINNLERAKKSVDQAKEIEPVKEGIDLIFKSIFDFLSSRGLKEIDAVGKEFDTDLHEALTKIPAPEETLKGKVVDVIEKGYTLNDKVIRFAKVVVGE
jgi:molecular chaperone GrpE